MKHNIFWKENKMKKLLVLLFCILTAVSAFAGGKSAAGSGTAAAGGGAKKYSAIPFVPAGKNTFTVFVSGLTQNITSYDYKDNVYTKMVVDKTGVMLEFIATTGADASVRLNTLLASGDYPDLIIRRSMSYNDVMYWASQGVFIPLDDYNVTSYPNIAQAFEEYPALNQKLRGADDKLYALPRVDDAIWSTYQQGRTWYYLPWIRDTSRKIPETLDEFTAYLRWIRDNDVNGNGDKNDEIPIAFSSGDLENATAFFAKSFMPFIKDSTGFGLALYDGKVTEQYRLNEYREALKYMAGLYKEGLIKEDSFTLTVDQLKGLALSPVPVLGIMMNNYNHNVAGTTGIRSVEFFQMPMLKGPTGERYAPNREPWGILQFGMFITDKCKDPELAIALYDYMLNWEIMKNGEPVRGISWDYPDPGALGLDGAPALYKNLLNDRTMPLNSYWENDRPAFSNKKYVYGQQGTDIDIIRKYFETGDKSLAAKVAESDYLIPSLVSGSNMLAQWEIPQQYFIPPMPMNDADSKRVADIKAVLDPYKDQAIAEFVTGARDINNNAAWNAYLADLDRIGSKDLVTIYQKYIK
jgi:putative aldouronate transport system substrate-binding protein